MEQRNAMVYRDPRIVTSYANDHDLHLDELAVLRLIQANIAGQPILDIGIGAGRTTPHLLRLAGEYIGIDYSPEMVDVAAQRYPQATMAVGDVRNLSAYPDDHFALVLFSYNGLDSIPHSDRLVALREMWRKVRQGGYLVFSSHNRPAFRFYLEPAPTLRKRARHVAEYFRQHVKRLFNRRWEIEADEYAVINDCAHNNRLMNYYISLDHQKKQFADLGMFGDLHVFDKDGGAGTQQSDSYCLAYCLRKAAP